jgi:hypothetical protein
MLFNTIVDTNIDTRIGYILAQYLVVPIVVRVIQPIFPPLCLIDLAKSIVEKFNERTWINQEKKQWIRRSF